MEIKDLLKIKDHLLYFKSFILCLIIIILIVMLFYFKIPLTITLEGVCKCNLNECCYKAVSSFKLQQYIDDLKEISINNKEKINKIVFEKPYMFLYFDADEFKNNEVVKSVFTLKEETIISLFLKSLKGGDEIAL